MLADSPLTRIASQHSRSIASAFFLGRPPTAAYTSPRKRGEVSQTSAPIQLKAIML